MLAPIRVQANCTDGAVGGSQSDGAADAQQLTNLPPSLLPSAYRVHELAPALCDLLPLPGLRFRHSRRRLSETCWRLGRGGGRLSLTLVLLIGVVLGRGHELQDCL
jgi:hypothetical protein